MTNLPLASDSIDDAIRCTPSIRSRALVGKKRDEAQAQRKDEQSPLYYSPQSYEGLVENAVSGSPLFQSQTSRLKICPCDPVPIRES
jgi:hypothetical protein